MPNYMETLKRVLDGSYDSASEAEKTAAVRDLIQVCSIAAGAVAIQPIPFVDTALISPIQIGLVQGVGRIHGVKLDSKSVVEILSTFGASIVAQNVIMAAAKFVPFLGWVVAPSMAFALTFAVGEVSDYYFRTGRGVPQEELKAMFEKIYKQKRSEKEESLKKSGSLKDRLEQLKEAFSSGLITEAEYHAKKEELLKSF
jgi:uncharacterized protein (DUF697 family)